MSVASNRINTYFLTISARTYPAISFEWRKNEG